VSQPSSIFTDVGANCRGALIAAGIVSLFVNVLMLTVPLYMLQIFDRVLMSRSDETLFFLSVAAVGALVVSSRQLTVNNLPIDGSVRRLGPNVKCS